MPIKDLTTLPPHEQRFHLHRQEFQDYLPLVEQAQVELQEDVEELQAQEGWNLETREGVAEWVRDRDSIWRALRRNRYDPDKTHAFLLSALTHRLTLNLHRPIPSSLPYAHSQLFFILPLPRFTDRLGRPIAVLTLREVVRDDSGGLDDMKEWVWWALELVRRVLRDWWRGTLWNGNEKRKNRGYGGEGCLLLIDAKGAGYRNMEVELLPTLFSVGHNNFPGIFEAVYIVNAGWSHRAMWNSIVKRVLPRSALDKVNFLETKEDLGTVFDLIRLPKDFGGENSYTFSSKHNPILHRYSNLPSTSSAASCQPSRQPSRTQSSVSIADIYYTAHNSPSSSRALTRSHSFANGLGIYGLGSSKLAMTKSRENTSHHSITAANGPISSKSAIPPPTLSASTVLGESAVGNSTGPDPVGLEKVNEKLARVYPNDRSPFDEDLGQTNRDCQDCANEEFEGVVGPSNPQSSPIQRMKSLSNFHLYLSPSRLAHRDLLSDSEDDEPDQSRSARVAAVSALSMRKNKHSSRQSQRGDLERQTVASRRARPELRLNMPSALGEVGGENDDARAYSHQLQQHHARGLEMYSHVLGPTDRLMRKEENDATTPRADDTAQTPSAEISNKVFTAAHRDEQDTSTDHHVVETTTITDRVEPIPLYSSANPWFGYPAVLVPDTSPGGRGYAIRPRYARNRKRDLVKTLLFLFTLRLQAWRDAVERALGLNRLWSGGRGGGVEGYGVGEGDDGDDEEVRRREREARNPGEGLVARGSASRRGEGSGMVKYGVRREGEWVWMVIGFLILRGTWTRLVGGALEAMGMESVKSMLGL